MHESGVHATIAGVALGFLTPARPFYPPRDTSETIADQLGTLVAETDEEVSEATMSEVSRLSREAVAPLVRMEHALHPWSAFVVLPLFALANAGVEVTLDGLSDALTGPVGLGILLGLVVGRADRRHPPAHGPSRASPARRSPQASTGQRSPPWRR